MKKILTGILCAAIAAASIAVPVSAKSIIKGVAGATSPAAVSAPAAPAPAQAAAPGGSLAGVTNPITSYASYSALLKNSYGVMMSDVPAGSKNVAYTTINAAPFTAQIQFTYAGHDYTYRGALMSSTDTTDISGVYDVLSRSASFVSATNHSGGIQYTIRYSTSTSAGVASWYYPGTGCRYTLYTPTGCNAALAIQNVIDRVLPIRTDINGNAISTQTKSTVRPAATGSIRGTVASVHNNDIVVNTAVGSSVFLLNYINNVSASAGDTVVVRYSGNINDSPQALSITIEKRGSQSSASTVTGVISNFTSSSMQIEVSNGNIYTFKRNLSTKYSGKTTVLDLDNTVKVTYTGNLSHLPVATEIQTTKIDSGSSQTTKTFKGYVNNVASKVISVESGSGVEYDFRKDNHTKVQGKYDLEQDCQVTITYTGTLSKVPYASTIRVTAPAHTPQPTPKPSRTYTDSGEIVVSFNNIIVLATEDGRESTYMVDNAKFSGHGTVGDSADITYHIDSHGDNIATKVTFHSTPSPRPYTTTVVGTVIQYSGNYLCIQDDYGSVYDFYLSDPLVIGRGQVGDDARVTYTDDARGNLNATRIEFIAPYPYLGDDTTSNETLQNDSAQEPLLGAS